MKAEFSEFTYGFSLVNEMAKAFSCTAVPIFPSLLEEGKEGGGYDAKLLYRKGKFLYLQFKLSDWMKARTTREYKVPGHSLSLPYYRFEITSERISKQHSLLLSLESIESLTFYVAPAFHLNDEIDAHWTSGSVTQNSVFVKPSSIGGICAVTIFGVEIYGTRVATVRIPATSKPYCPIQTERDADFPRNHQYRPIAHAAIPSGLASV